MNERIKLLESQCWEARQYGPPWFDAKKFAELIVLECASLVVDDDNAYDMLKHFGVEE